MPTTLPIRDLMSLEFRQRGFGKELYSNKFPEVVSELEDDNLTRSLNEEFSARGFMKSVESEGEHAAAAAPPEKYLSPLTTAAMIGAGVLAAKELGKAFKTPAYKMRVNQPSSGGFQSLAGPSKNYEAEEDYTCPEEGPTYHGQMGLPGGPEEGEDFKKFTESLHPRDESGKFDESSGGGGAAPEAGGGGDKAKSDPMGPKDVMGESQQSPNQVSESDAAKMMEKGQRGGLAGMFKGSGVSMSPSAARGTFDPNSESAVSAKNELMAHIKNINTWNNRRATEPSWQRPGLNERPKMTKSAKRMLEMAAFGHTVDYQNPGEPEHYTIQSQEDFKKFTESLHPRDESGKFAEGSGGGGGAAPEADRPHMTSKETKRKKIDPTEAREKAEAKDKPSEQEARQMMSGIKSGGSLLDKLFGGSGASVGPQVARGEFDYNSKDAQRARNKLMDFLDDQAEWDKREREGLGSGVGVREGKQPFGSRPTMQQANRRVLEMAAFGHTVKYQRDKVADVIPTFHGQLGLPQTEQYKMWAEHKVSRDKNGRFRKKKPGALRDPSLKKGKRGATRPTEVAKGAGEPSTTEQIVLAALQEGPLTLAELAEVTKISQSNNSPLVMALASLRDAGKVKSKKVDGKDTFELTKK